MLAVLCLSANTSFVGFPRLCHLVARDGFLPRPFAVAGRRLVYTVGVLFLAVLGASFIMNDVNANYAQILKAGFIVGALYLQRSGG